MRRRARTDANHAQIIEAFRRCGFTVRSTHAVGSGFPDLVIGRAGRIGMVEVKDGSLPPSRQALTEDERDFHRAWPVMLVRCVDDVLEISRRWNAQPAAIATA